MVPVLYQQQAHYVPFRGKRGQAQAESEVLKLAHERCPKGRFGFIGRDYDLLRLERALRHDDRPWALLAGMGGIGKTELARGFARWFAETGGCPGGVFAASFKEKADFGQVIGSIAGFGTDFSRLPEPVQREKLIDYLRGNAGLLVWDNFEPVAGYPEGAEPLATPEERGKLAGFLQALRGGQSRVLLTTRKQKEDWLGIACELVELEGLTERDAGDFARLVLATAGKKPEEFKDDPDYARLIGLLNGHPRSLEVMLPHLRCCTPREIIESLQHRTDQLGESVEDASLGFAFSRLSERARRHLPLVGLFVSLVHADVLGLFVGSGGEPQAAYAELLGESLDAAGWEGVLDEAARAGILRALGQRLYELHPTLPPFFRRRFERAIGEEGLRHLDVEFMKFYGGFGAHVFEDVQKADPASLATVECEEANFLRALRLAELNQSWALAQAIAQTLDFFYEARGRKGEWRAVRTRLLRAVGEPTSAAADRQRANLWMYLLGTAANEALERHDLDEAEAGHQRILKYVVAVGEPAVGPKIATACQQLGRIAEERQRLDEAEQWNRKALKIRERLALERDATGNYHQLGIIAQKRQRFDEAEQWHRKALGIEERLGLERGAATDYHELGMIAQERQRLEEAEKWYGKALEIFERLGLGRDAATDYHQLGIIAQKRQRFDEAGQWYCKALEIFERLGHPPLEVETLAQLGLLRRDQGRLPEAVAWLGAALAIAAEYKMLVGGQILADLARLLHAVGERAFTSAWQQAFPGQEPPLEAIRSAADKPDSE